MNIETAQICTNLQKANKFGNTPTKSAGIRLNQNQLDHIHDKKAADL
jgi:hypothetical protein